MIGGDGINDESNKTAPAPTRNTDLTKYMRMRDGEWEYPGGIEEPDLSGYDRFITGTDDGGEER